MCIFCKIISGEIPSYKVYEDEKTLAILDAFPLRAGHTLVIAKKHYSNLSEIPDDDLKDLIIKVKQVASLLTAKLDFTDYKISENNGTLAGQSVPHIHFHIVPQYPGEIISSPKKFAYQPGEAEEIIKKLQV